MCVNIFYSMKTIAHRINTLEDLKKVKKEDGIEIDLRGNPSTGDIYLQHDHFKTGLRFEELLDQYKYDGRTGTIILDVKEERLEYKILELLKKYDISDYFFLDCSFPMINYLVTHGEHNVAIRFSEFEGMDTVRNMAGKANWVWVDTFNKNPLTLDITKEIHDLGYKICFVSPELQGQPLFREAYLREAENFDVEAVCTDEY